MIIARWNIDAKFGYKQHVVDLMRRWLQEIGSQVGFTEEKTRLLTGSIGACESTIQTEHVVQDLAELNSCWEKLASLDAHKQWGKELEPFVVSGSNRWEIYRVL